MHVAKRRFWKKLGPEDSPDWTLRTQYDPTARCGDFWFEPNNPDEDSAMIEDISTTKETN